MVAARIANMRREDTLKQNTDSPDVLTEPRITQQQAADQLKVSTGTLKRAKKAIEHGAPELVKAVDAGEIKVGA